MKHIVVIGFMASGKTRVGIRLAKDLNLPFVDLDKQICVKLRMSVSQIFKRFGEPFYRALETFFVKELLANEEKTVISLGAGFPLQQQNEKLLKQLGTVVYLSADGAVILERLRAMDETGKPMDVQAEEKILNQLKARSPIYEKYADIIVQTGTMPFDELVARIETELEKKS